MHAYILMIVCFQKSYKVQFRFNTLQLNYFELLCKSITYLLTTWRCVKLSLKYLSNFVNYTSCNKLKEKKTMQKRNLNKILISPNSQFNDWFTTLQLFTRLIIFYINNNFNSIQMSRAVLAPF